MRIGKALAKLLPGSGNRSVAAASRRSYDDCSYNWSNKISDDLKKTSQDRQLISLEQSHELPG